MAFRRKSRREKAATTAQARLADVKGRVGPAAGAAAGAARDRAGAARDKAAPVALAARDRAVETTQKRVVPAAISAKDVVVEKATPAVETARDKVVDDLLPRLAEAALAAATAAAAARDHAVEGAQDAATQAVANLPANKRKRRRRRFLALTVLLAAAGGAAAAWKSKQSPAQDPWTAAPATDTRIDVVKPATATQPDSAAAVVIDSEQAADGGTTLDEASPNGTAPAGSPSHAKDGD